MGIARAGMGLLLIALCAAEVGCVSRSSGFPTETASKKEKRKKAVQCARNADSPIRAASVQLDSLEAGVLHFDQRGVRHTLYIRPIPSGVRVTMTPLASPSLGVRIEADPSFEETDEWGLLALDFNECGNINVNKSFAVAKRQGADLTTMPIALDPKGKVVIGRVWGESEYILASN